MKRSELDMFSNQSHKMNPKFKNQLRSQLMAAAKKGKTAKRSRVLWPAYAAVPALAVVAVLVMVGLNLGNTSDPKRPLAPATVSAAQVLQRAIDATQKFDPSAYSYVMNRETTTSGPADGSTCYIMGDKLTDEGYVPEYQKNEYWNYVYHDKQNIVEATYYGTSASGDAAGSVTTSVYDNTEKVVLADNPYQGASSLKEELEIFYFDGKPTKLFVDKQGNQLTSQDVKPVKKDGRMVYELFTKRNPETLGISPDAPNYACATEMIDYQVIDAKTFLPIEFSGYRKTVSDSNLISTTKYEFEYLNIGEDEAIAKMEAAGFDKATALPEYPSGGDFY